MSDKQMNFEQFRNQYHSDLDSTIEQMVTLALEEDLQLSIGGTDITAALIPEAKQVSARLISRETGILCGRQWFEACFKRLDETCELIWYFDDGEEFQTNAVLCEVRGLARQILSAERSAMNFLQTLSATASHTSRYVKQLSQHNCRLLDTRKTLPGFRLAQKYAVLCGGGQNHRIGLFDAYLIKENHIAACGSINNAVSQAKENRPENLIEVEVESLDELQQAIEAGADVVMLDNFTNAELRDAVAMNASQVKLEASGNINLDTIQAVAETGVDYISVGAITKNITATDFSLLLD